MRRCAEREGSVRPMMWTLFDLEESLAGYIYVLVPLPRTEAQKVFSLLCEGVRNYIVREFKNNEELNSWFCFGKTERGLFKQFKSFEHLVLCLYDIEQEGANT